MHIHVTEHKSVSRLDSDHTVRVFVNRDYHYGYWVSEHLLFSLLTPEQQEGYLQCGEFKCEVPTEIAQRIIEDGQTPFQKQVLN